jgi:hypothetical protein
MTHAQLLKIGQDAIKDGTVPTVIFVDLLEAYLAQHKVLLEADRIIHEYIKAEEKK